MAELRLHHTYARGAAVDVSDNGNHGEVIDAYPASNGSALTFDSPASRVQVAPSESLGRFRSIRVRVRFRLDPDAAPEQRYNLMEGYLSFALYVTPEFALRGTIYDAEENWRGVTSDDRLVTPGRWHTAELTYVDSAARVDLRLDGKLVGSKQGVAGPVRPVGELGLSIGIWPDSDRYALDGQLDEAKLWATWPEFEEFVDPCCADLGALDRVTKVLRSDPAVQNRDVDPTAILRGLQTISARVRAKLVGDDPDRAAAVRQLERDFESAYQERDLRGILTTFAKGYRLMAAADVSGSAMVDEGKEGIELLRRVELGRQVLDPLRELDASGGGSGIATRRRRPTIPEPPEEVRDLVGSGARALCLPVPTDDSEPLPSTEPDDNWGEIPHEPWPERPDHDPEEIERERERRRNDDERREERRRADREASRERDERRNDGESARQPSERDREIDDELTEPDRLEKPLFRRAFERLRGESLRPISEINDDGDDPDGGYESDADDTGRGDDCDPKEGDDQ
jgi:hypothetical protein